MDPVSSLNSNTSQFYVAFGKDANISYAADTGKEQQKTVSKTEESSKSSGTETKDENKSETEQKTSTSYIVDIMDEDEDGVVTTKELISYYKELATSKQEELDKQIKNSKATIEEIKTEAKSSENTAKANSNDTQDIVTPEEQAKEIQKEVGFKDENTNGSKDIQDKTANNDIIAENQKAIFSRQDNKNLPSFMALENSTNNPSNVINIDKKQQEAAKAREEEETTPLDVKNTEQKASESTPLEVKDTEKQTVTQDIEDTASPLELKETEQQAVTQDTESTASPLELQVDSNNSEPLTVNTDAKTTGNPLSTEEQNSDQNNVYDINDYKLKKAVNSYQTVELNDFSKDYTSKISINI